MCILYIYIYILYITICVCVYISLSLYIYIYIYIVCLFVKRKTYNNQTTKGCAKARTTMLTTKYNMPGRGRLVAAASYCMLARTGCGARAGC